MYMYVYIYIYTHLYIDDINCSSECPSSRNTPMAEHARLPLAQNTRMGVASLKVA